MSWTLLLALLVGIVAAVGEPPPIVVDVVVEGERVEVEAPATVERALDAAGVTPRDGVLLSAGTGSVLDPHWDPAVLLLDDAPTTRGALMLPDQQVAVVPGEDEVEPPVRSEVVVPHERPDVERAVWTPGSDGLDEVVQGEVSGEIVSRTPIVTPVAATPVEGPIVSLTFDDGPHPVHTPVVLEILREANVRAVFCVVGNEVRRYPDLMRAIHAEGHLLCNHSMTHADLTTLSPDEVDAEIADTTAAIVEVLGEEPAFFRAPFGALDETVIETAHRHDLRVLGWSVDTNDWRGRSAAAIVDEVLTSTTPGAVVLMHDGGGDRTETVAALVPMLAGLVDAGYVIVVPPT